MEKLITPQDNATGQQPQPFIYWCITCELPKTDENGQAVLDFDNNPIYETNYFCRRLVNKKTGIVAIEWDTDCHYAQRFRTDTGATNYLNVVLENIEGAKVQKHPFSL